MGLDKNFKGSPLHGAFSDSGWGQLTAAKARNKRLCTPLSELHSRLQALPAQGPAAKTAYVRLYRGFIDEHQTARFSPHGRLAIMLPVRLGRCHISSFLLRCQKRFLYVSPVWRSARESDAGATVAPCSDPKRLASFGIVTSGHASTSLLRKSRYGANFACRRPPAGRGVTLPIYCQNLSSFTAKLGLTSNWRAATSRELLWVASSTTQSRIFLECLSHEPTPPRSESQPAQTENL